MVEVEFFAAGRDFAEDAGFGQRVEVPAGGLLPGDASVDKVPDPAVGKLEQGVDQLVGVQPSSQRLVGVSGFMACLYGMEMMHNYG